MYRVPGPHKKPRGGTYAYRGAADQAEFDELLKKGWFPSYEEALWPQARKEILAIPSVIGFVDEVSAPTRDELEAKAKELGVSFNGRTSDKKLAERIAEALEG
jgi:hypothetical protein